VTKSETESERLRAHARRSLKLADAIADEEASRALKAYAAELLERADALRAEGREHNSGFGATIPQFKHAACTPMGAAARNASQENAL
jgi:hypothetical protein